MTGPRHEFLTNVLTDLGAKRVGFRRAVQDLFDNYEVFSGEIRIPNRIPDAYRIDRADDGIGHVIRVWEVECTHALPWEKLCDYADFWDALDYSCLPIDFEVIAVDPSGHPFTVNLCQIVYDRLALAAEERAAS